MNPRKTTIAILATLSVSLALADDFKTINGKEYKDAEVSRVASAGIVLKTKSGISKVYFVELPIEVQKRFGYNPSALQKSEELQPKQTQQTAAPLARRPRERRWIHRRFRSRTR